LSLAPKFVRKRIEKARPSIQKDLAELLNRHRFRIVKIGYMSLPLDQVRQTAFVNAVRNLLHVLNRIPLLEQMGVSCMVVARKLA
jgi:hypothetical protein